MKRNKSFYTIIPIFSIGFVIFFKFHLLLSALKQIFYADLTLPHANPHIDTAFLEDWNSSPHMESEAWKGLDDDIYG